MNSFVGSGGAPVMDLFDRGDDKPVSPKTRRERKRRVFGEHLRRVLSPDQYLQFNLIITAQQKIGSTTTTLSLIPIFSELRKLFEGVEWNGKRGGLIHSYEEYVPGKYLEDYRSVMLKSMQKSSFTSTSLLDICLNNLAKTVEHFSVDVIRDAMRDYNMALKLRQHLFYHLFTYVAISEGSSALRSIQINLPKISRQVLCFDKTSFNEISAFLGMSDSEMGHLIEVDRLQLFGFPDTLQQKQQIQHTHSSDLPRRRNKNNGSKNSTEFSNNEKKEKNCQGKELIPTSSSTSSTDNSFLTNFLKTCKKKNKKKSEKSVTDNRNINTTNISTSTSTSTSSSSSSGSKDVNDVNKEKLFSQSHSHSSQSYLESHINDEISNLKLSYDKEEQERLHAKILQESQDHELALKLSTNSNIEEFKNDDENFGSHSHSQISRSNSHKYKRNLKNKLSSSFSKKPIPIDPNLFKYDRLTKSNAFMIRSNSKECAPSNNIKNYKEPVEAEYDRVLAEVEEELEEEEEELALEISRIESTHREQQEYMNKPRQFSQTEPQREFAQENPLIKELGDCERPEAQTCRVCLIENYAIATFCEKCGRNEIELKKMTTNQVNEAKKQRNNEGRGVEEREEVVGNVEGSDESDDEYRQWRKSLLKHTIRAKRVTALADKARCKVDNNSNPSPNPNSNNQKNSLDNEKQKQIQSSLNKNDTEASQLQKTSSSNSNSKQVSDASQPSISSQGESTSSNPIESNKPKPSKEPSKPQISPLSQPANSKQSTEMAPFLPWECELCHFNNDSSAHICVMCGEPTSNRQMAPLVSGTVKSFNQSRRIGFITPSSGGRDVFLRRSDIQTSDYWVVPGEQVMYRCSVQYQKNPIAFHVHSRDLRRQQLSGHCQSLDEEKAYGWIRLPSTGGRGTTASTRPKSDVFFFLSDYLSSRRPYVGQKLRFQIDLTCSQPRALFVKPLLFEEEEEDYRLKSSENMNQRSKNQLKNRHNASQFVDSNNEESCENNQLDIFAQKDPFLIYFGSVCSQELKQGDDTRLSYGNRTLGQIKPENGAERVEMRLNTTHIYTRDSSLNEGDSVQFMLDKKKLDLTGFAIAQRVIRIPCEKFNGKCLRYLPDRQFGFISIQDVSGQKKRDIYFHRNTILKNSDPLEFGNGVRVRFEIDIFGKSIRANKVEIQDEIDSDSGSENENDIDVCRDRVKARDRDRVISRDKVNAKINNQAHSSEQESVEVPENKNETKSKERSLKIVNRSSTSLPKNVKSFEHSSPNTILGSMQQQNNVKKESSKTVRFKNDIESRYVYHDSSKKKSSSSSSNSRSSFEIESDLEFDEVKKGSSVESSRDLSREDDRNTNTLQQQRKGICKFFNPRNKSGVLLQEDGDGQIVSNEQSQLVFGERDIQSIDGLLIEDEPVVFYRYTEDASSGKSNRSSGLSNVDRAIFVQPVDKERRRIRATVCYFDAVNGSGRLMLLGQHHQIELNFHISSFRYPPKVEIKINRRVTTDISLSNCKPVAYDLIYLGDNERDSEDSVGNETGVSLFNYEQPQRYQYTNNGGYVLSGNESYVPVNSQYYDAALASSNIPANNYYPVAIADSGIENFYQSPSIYPVAAQQLPSQPYIFPTSYINSHQPIPTTMFPPQQPGAPMNEYSQAYLSSSYRGHNSNGRGFGNGRGKHNGNGRFVNGNKRYRGGHFNGQKKQLYRNEHQ